VGGASRCGALSAGTTTYTLHLLNAPAADKLITITIVAGTTSTLVSSVNPVPLSYTVGSGTYNAASPAPAITVSSGSNVFFQVDLTTVPTWLSISPTSGTTGSTTLTVVPTSGVGALFVGSYTANVHLKVSGALDFVLPVVIQINNASSTLSFQAGPGQTISTNSSGVAQGAQTINWIIGTSLPTVTITPISSDAPIAFSVACAGSLGATTSLTDSNGLAYSFGSPFTVSFSQSAFAGFAPGQTKSGTVTLTPNGTTTNVVFTITIKVQPQTALISSISPSILPTATSGTFTVSMVGSGFVTGASQTVVGVVTGTSPQVLVVDNNVTATIQNTTSIIVTISVPSSADPYLPFSGNGGTVTLGVCNPQSGSTVCSMPTGTQTLTIGINPIVSAVTSASSYAEVSAPTLPTIAPYDILSIFGSNFCVSGGTGCVPGGTNPVLYGSAAAPTYGYPFSLSPDAAGATQRNLTVTFYPHGSTTNAIGTAPLLFASNNQINLVAPAALASHETAGSNQVDILVSFGYGSGSTMLKSLPFTVNVAATDPGVFTVGGDGQGDAAALAAQTYALITQRAPSIVRSTASDSDTIMLYVTGLGVPDSTYAGTTPTEGTGNSTYCMTPAEYYGDVNTATSVSPSLQSDDGLAINYSFISSPYTAPCFLIAGSNIPTVTVGGQPASVQYAGWVSGSVAGLYQINVQLPGATPTMPEGSAAWTYDTGNPDISGTSTPASIGTTTAALVPVVITTPSNSKTSQTTGVDLWLLQGLKGTVTGAGSASGLPGNQIYTYAGSHGTTLTGTALQIVGTEGTAVSGSVTYTYAVSSNSPNPLPADLTLNDDGSITGTIGSDMEGTTTVMFTVTDGNGLTGNVTINFVIS
jgi:uncharacterized protein (TIGR03437 family)